MWCQFALEQAESRLQGMNGLWVNEIVMDPNQYISHSTSLLGSPAVPHPLSVTVSLHLCNSITQSH